MNAARDGIPKEYLAATDVIDYAAPDVRTLAAEIRDAQTEDSVVAPLLRVGSRSHRTQSGLSTG
ncbi:MAG: hypothetical protein R3C20_19160 [Planctomycetaceae bacterium]